MFAEVDDDIYEKIKDIKWTKNDNSNPHTTYAKSVIDGEVIHLHRLVVGLPPFTKSKQIVNHKDGNGLNNKRENLEICDACYNSQSVRCPNKNEGCVYYDTTMKRKKRWRANIIINKIR